MASKVQKIKVMNLKAISAFEADLKGCTAIITGKNNSGKSSFLKSLPDRFRGIKPDVILKHNESEGYAEWELTTGERFIWAFDKLTKKGERLTFITLDQAGNEIKTSVTEDIMKRYFPDVFDVDAFLQATPAKQRKTLQNLCNVDFTDIDGRYTAAYEERAFKNKKLTEAEAILNPVNNSLATEEIPTEEVQKELNLIDSHNEKYDGIKNGVTEKEAKLPKTQQEIKRLKQLLKAAEDEEKQLIKQIADGKTWLDIDKNKHKDEAYTDNLNQQLFEIQKKNALIVQNNKNIKAAEDVKALRTEATDADKAVKAIIKEKDEVIAKAKMPDGFGFSDDGITYNGFAFNREQLSSSSIYIGALKLASMDLGEVKMLHFDASFLDKVSLAEIETWANGEGLQLLIERPDFEAGEIKYELINETI